MKSKTLRKIITYKIRNRRISQILKHLESVGEWKYYRDKSQFNGMNKFELINQMDKNSTHLIHLRSKIKESENGS